MSEWDIFSLVDEFIEKSSNLAAILKQDLACFSTNNIEQIEKNNSQKSKLQNCLNSIINTLQASSELSCYQGSLYQKLSYYKETLPAAHKSKLDMRLATMQHTLSDYKQSLLINGFVVSANLSFLKDLVLAALYNQQKQKSEEGVYDNQGALDLL